MFSLLMLYVEAFEKMLKFLKLTVQIVVVLGLCVVLFAMLKALYTGESANLLKAPAQTIQLPDIVPQTVVPTLKGKVLTEMHRYSDLQKVKLNVELESIYDLPKGLLAAVHSRETDGNCAVESYAGAQGCFQFLPSTRKEVELLTGHIVDPYDYFDSAKAAAAYFKYLRDSIRRNYGYEGNVLTALSIAAYHAGITNVLKFLDNVDSPAYSTVADVVQSFPNYWVITRSYVVQVMAQVATQKHVVVKGDTMYSISKKYGLNLTELILYHGTHNIKVGEVIVFKQN